MDQEKRNIYDHVSKYVYTSWLLSLWNIITTFVLLYICFSIESIFIIPLMALLLTRTFIIFHDIGHDSFFPLKIKSRYNNIVGILIGTLVLTPFSNWVSGHNYHHKHSNKLDKRQHTQTSPWEIKRYKNASYFKKIMYKFMYGKYTLFSIVPSIYFMIFQHFGAHWYENLIHVLYLISLITFSSYYKLICYIIAYFLSGIFGFILFHFQHTFDGVYKEKGDDWDYFKNGLYGSSFIQIPWYLKYFTCGTEYHHIHHLNAKVPSYYLKKCHGESGELFNNVKKVYLSDIFKTCHYSLYNADKKQFDDVHNY